MSVLVYLKMKKNYQAIFCIGEFDIMLFYMCHLLFYFFIFDFKGKSNKTYD